MGHVHDLGPPPFPLEPEFLAWLRHNGEVYRRSHDGQLPPTKDWDYLIRRYLEDPARFIRNHPLIGGWIARIPPAPPPPVIIVPPVPPPTGSQTITPPPGGSGSVPPSIVPEPASWVLLGVGVAVVVVFLAFRGPRK
jgi:PEP-CTERM motif